MLCFACCEPPGLPQTKENDMRHLKTTLAAAGLVALTLAGAQASVAGTPGDGVVRAERDCC